MHTGPFEDAAMLTRFGDILHAICQNLMHAYHLDATGNLAKIVNRNLAIFVKHLTASTVTQLYHVMFWICGENCDIPDIHDIPGYSLLLSPVADKLSQLEYLKRLVCLRDFLVFPALSSKLYAFVSCFKKDPIEIVSEKQNVKLQSVSTALQKKTTALH
ncbi:hypothetical protein WISP_123509 [Willisornis vidua]|uniref:Uncharacterized protein n=1 Tax=Willisornis vidua TaxID=1566151 RepID=A0ABQ9CXB3_9PASS|nr:hypothetical protein WISP_123509 [Willisornis vidua]